MAFGDFTVVRSTVKRVLNSSGVLAEVAINTPAFEFNADGTYRGLLVEPAATNLALRSAEFDTGAIWVPTEATVTANATTAPNGLTTADKLLTNTNSAEHSVVQSNFSFTSGTAYTFSVWMKAGEIGFGFVNFPSGAFGSVLRNYVNLSTGAVTLAGGVTGEATAFPNGWYRFRVTATATASVSSNMRVGLTDSNSSTTSTGANATDGIFLWGAQLETGSVATSYIPTVASTANRTADSVTLTGASSLIGQSAGTMFVEINTNLFNSGGVSTRLLAISDPSAPTTKRLLLTIIRGANTQLNATVTNSTSQFSSTSGNISAGTHRLAMGYATDDFVFYANGVQVSTDNSGTIPSNLSVISIGTHEDPATLERPVCWIRSVALFPTRLANATLATLTT